MSRRKQSNPRQIKRTFGEMEEGDEAPREDNSPLEREAGASDHEGSVEGDSSSSPCSDEAEPKENSASPKEPDKQETLEESQEKSPWNGPGGSGRPRVSCS